MKKHLCILCAVLLLLPALCIMVFASKTAETTQFQFTVNVNESYSETDDVSGVSVISGTDNSDLNEAEQLGFVQKQQKIDKTTYVAVLSALLVIAVVILILALHHKNKVETEAVLKKAESEPELPSSAEEKPLPQKGKKKRPRHKKAQPEKHSESKMTEENENTAAEENDSPKTE